MKLLANILYCTTIIILFNSCTNHPEKERTNESLEQYIPSIYKISELYILTDKVCPSCNNQFSRNLEKRINNESCFIIVSASPGKVNTKKFENATNVLYDYEKKYLNFGFPDSSAKYIFDKGVLISKTLINPENVDSILD